MFVSREEFNVKAMRNSTGNKKSKSGMVDQNGYRRI
jgi:hypothetical protein